MDFCLSAKRSKVAYWVRSMSRCNSRVLVDAYSYSSCVTKEIKHRTLIVFPDRLSKGIIAIHKPLEEVELADVIGLYKRIN